jgi:hypothetical protein
MSCASLWILLVNDRLILSERYHYDDGGALAGFHLRNSRLKSNLASFLKITEDSQPHLSFRRYAEKSGATLAWKVFAGSGCCRFAILKGA